MALPNATVGQTNIVISAETIRDFGEMSQENIRIVKDHEASHGLALEFTGGDNIPAVAEPTVWFRIEFLADAAEYFVWIRAKTDGDTLTDSTWIQFDDQIGTDQHTADKIAPERGLGNWRDAFDEGVYVWASQDAPPPSVVSVEFEEQGLHTLLMQPRQVPHFIDQVLLSQEQDERPKDEPWPWNPARNPHAVAQQGKLATTWSSIKSH